MTDSKDLAPPPVSPAPSPALERSVPTTAPQPKARPIPRRARDAIELIATGQCKTITAAAKRVGLSRENLSRRLSRPECIEAMKVRAAKAVALGAGRAAAVLIELLESSSQKVRLDAAKHTLSTAGIAPANSPQVSINVEARAGWVIDLSEPGQPMRIVAGAAKPLDAPAPKVIDAKPVE